MATSPCVLVYQHGEHLLVTSAAPLHCEALLFIRKKIPRAPELQAAGEQCLYVIAISPDGSEDVKPACSLVDQGSTDVKGGALASLAAWCSHLTCWSKPHLSFR